MSRIGKRHYYDYHDTRPRLRVLCGRMLPGWIGSTPKRRSRKPSKDDCLQCWRKIPGLDNSTEKR